MHVDLATQKPRELAAEIAVVGSGAAGQTIARALADSGHSTLMLESGGLDYERTTADLNVGENVGRPYYPLEDARLRLFGGTTAIWGGRCAELNSIDLERRPWVAWSGWPLVMDDLRPYYDLAWRTLGLPTPNGASPPATLRRFAGGQMLPYAWQIDHTAERFGSARNADLLGHPSLTILTHATVREIVQADNGRSVDHLDVRGPDGERIVAKAKIYIIAAGGIENARLLLVSNRVQANGLGNSRDLVGRFFMEHPHGRGGRVVGSARWRLMRSFQKRSAAGHDVAWLLAGSPEFQRNTGALNGALTLALRRPLGERQFLFERSYCGAKLRMEPNERGRMMLHAYRRLGRLARATVSPVTQWQRLQSGSAELAVVLRAEQSPNPDSRVRLADAVDALGMRRVALDWRLQRLDRASAAMLVKALHGELRRLGLGQIEPSKWLFDEKAIWRCDANVSSHPLAGYHHIGTTRMADDPSLGVTDRWGRVHGVENLYMAGSSLFPTAGWANPTLTILALSLRTADHLRCLLEQPRLQAMQQSATAQKAGVDRVDRAA